MTVERAPSQMEPSDAPDDPALERIQQDRQPGEIETGMMSGADEWEISATERFAGEVSREEALEVLDPEHHRRRA